ncbi:ABC transporter substrate-binding protein [Natronosalvus rutilus]|uniref:ABC transporter substrate-binding protein n=1 Tax=Natronosalvus rutilus TaxID=2953753 RepID=A0A9E7NBR8_9EURY|nr:ABC transporter substrate-binding protein [Natronosalvus rutilus]UTF55382.1 ABC transporter substrate-binding protein [Natronosalvus rutilus]
MSQGNRRQFLRGAVAGGAAGLTGLAGCIQSSGDGNGDGNGNENGNGNGNGNGGASGTVPLAVLEPFTGPFSALAEERHRGTELAIEQINESDEYEFEFEYEDYDTQLDSESAIQEANNAVQSQGAEFFTGCISSSVALAMNDFAQSNEVLYTPGAADVSITGENCNEWVFRFETSTAQIAEVMSRWLAEEMGGRLFYHIADYAYGDSVHNEIGTRMENLSDDYEEVGVTRSDPGSSNFASFITQISEASDEADALVVGMTGGDLATFLTQAKDNGLHDEIPIVTTTGSFRAVMAGAGEGAYGIYSGTRYVPTIETGDNQTFVSDYQDAYDGELPDNFSRVGYESIRMVANGIQEAGSTDPADVKDVLPGLEHETIFGPVEFRECDQQATNPVWMAECVEPEEGDIADVNLLDGWELDGEEAAPDCESTGCSL